MFLEPKMSWAHGAGLPHSRGLGSMAAARGLALKLGGSSER